MEEDIVIKLLVFRIGQLGDTLVTVPALHELRNRFPDAKIHYLYDHHIGKPFVVSKAVLEDSGLVDRFIPYQVGSCKREKLRAALGLVALLVKIRRISYNMVFLLYPERRSARQLKRDHFFFKCAGIPRVLGVDTYREGLPNPPFTKEQENEVDFYLKALSSELHETSCPGSGCMSLSLGAKDELSFERFPFSVPFESAIVPVAVGLGSKMPSKQWPVDRYVAVLEKLSKKIEILPVFLGGIEDFPVTEKVVESLGMGYNMCGKLTIRESARLMQYCRFYLGNDTGTMHLAVAAGLKCIAIFSARDVPGKWYPYGQGHCVHRLQVECEGCMLIECVQERKRCLTGISVASVLESCFTMIHELEGIPYAYLASD